MGIHSADTGQSIADESRHNLCEFTVALLSRTHASRYLCRLMLFVLLVACVCSNTQINYVHKHV